ncbi:YopX family protein [Clostridium sp. SYSU_GA19001]|uniref:YopX family protein n=1 Tax=Clostridium caldaquaticum TaxID=2940653 RepID=UPI002076F25D|nr:YopX family protein [Clostridium caldaquaticum]MCM8710516.1 YopX family protein [Clostridium caldaquaticum]
MREFKFRAWHKTLKIMFDVDMINLCHNEVVLVAINEEQLKLLKKIHKRKLIEYDNNKLITSLDTIELMQFTGMIDENGQDVYEGDIVKYFEYDEGLEELVNLGVGEVYFDDNYECNFTIKGEEPNSLGRYILKVVGNIYENPELIGEGNVPYREDNN